MAPCSAACMRLATYARWSTPSSSMNCACAGPIPSGGPYISGNRGLPLVGEPVEQHAEPAEQQRQHDEDAEHRQRGAEDAVESGRPRQRRLVRRRQVLAGEQRDRRVGVQSVGADRQVLVPAPSTLHARAPLSPILPTPTKHWMSFGRLGQVHGEHRLLDVLLPSLTGSGSSRTPSRWRRRRRPASARRRCGTSARRCARRPTAWCRRHRSGSCRSAPAPRCA